MGKTEYLQEHALEKNHDQGGQLFRVKIVFIAHLFFVPDVPYLMVSFVRVPLFAAAFVAVLKSIDSDQAPGIRFCLFCLPLPSRVVACCLYYLDSCACFWQT